MNTIVFLDALSRNIIGELCEEKCTETKLAIKNPAILDIAPNSQNSQLQLRMIPILFREFQANKDEPVTWFYNKDSIVMCEGLDLDFRITAQYQQMFSNIALPPSGPGGIVTPNGAPSTSAPAPIKLFD